MSINPTVQAVSNQAAQAAPGENLTWVPVELEDLQPGDLIRLMADDKIQAIGQVRLGYFMEDNVGLVLDAFHDNAELSRIFNLYPGKTLTFHKLELVG